MRDTVLALRSIDGKPHSIIPLTMDMSEDDSVWVGTCLELGTSAYADTLDELRSELLDAILLQLNETERLGFIEEYLKENRVRMLVLPPNAKPQSSERWGLVGAGAP